MEEFYALVEPFDRAQDKRGGIEPLPLVVDPMELPSHAPQ